MNNANSDQKIILLLRTLNFESIFQQNKSIDTIKE